MAEAMLNGNAEGRCRFRAYSAGSHPSGVPHPMALAQLQDAGVPIDGLHSKDFQAFAHLGAPRLDLIITVCDNAAAEVCPVWPGQPVTAHWGLPDPAAVQGSDAIKREAFATTFAQLQTRISQLVNLPLEDVDQASLRAALQHIGNS
jgi:arsenate reductase (thioredoxin)